MPLRENTPGALDKLRQRIRAVGDGSTRTGLSQVLAAAALKQVQDGFVESRDPYGRSWKQPADRAGQPLRDTGAMSGSAHTPRIGADGFLLALDQHHPGVHNRGAVIVPRVAPALSFVVGGARVFAQKVTIPKRQIVPDRARGLGPIWGPALKKEAADFLRRQLTGSSA
jgi:hypothetical protein